MNRVINKIVSEVSKIIVGKSDLLEKLAIATISEGHVLLEGMPGSGKTIIAKAFARAMGGEFKRIQMTPDLLPADIVGCAVYNMRKDSWEIRRGPIFANVVLVDELNRAPSRTQSALLEAMQEKQVTIEGETMPLPRPFLVLATQIYTGGEGTYPLTDVQIDRFAYRIEVSYPDVDEEVELLSRIDYIDEMNIEPVASPKEVSLAISEAKKVKVSEPVKRYIVSLVSKLRSAEEIKWGPSPRASIWLYKGSRSLAYMRGREYVIPDDVKDVALMVLSHRIRLKPEYEVEGVTPSELVERALREVEVPKA
ncbi:MAG: magnesium chelatase [Thermoprotei archaeon]|nr:MAG: magnesium chelatase [Thermoprotei archaeon]